MWAGPAARILSVTGSKGQTGLSGLRAGLAVVDIPHLCAAAAQTQRELWRSGPPTTPLRQIDWDISENVDEALATFSGESRAGATKATYASHLRQFLRYCLAAHISPPERLQSKSLAAWLMHRAHYGFKLSTIKLGVTAVSAAAGELGLPSLTHDRLVQKCLKAAARRRSSAEQQKLPVLKDLMEALLQSGDGTYASHRDITFYLLAWLGMFRCWSGRTCNARSVAS